ncbi:MAG: tRNA (cytidine(34)-2'-O)-methyltransferase [Myxococcales bacterium]|nr:tRNA (cytidine(34)-2'-O)-methyltransferase [Myxococcales bacterium]
MHIALYEPEIPGNTGSIGRVCLGTGCALHLIGRLGFSLDEKYVRRAGLDYWQHVDVTCHADLAAFVAALPGRRLWWFSARGGLRYDEARYGPDDVLVFGGETRGFPPAVRDQAGGDGAMVRLPMRGAIRSLNLANAVTAVVYEAWRQNGFPGSA